MSDAPAPRFLPMGTRSVLIELPDTAAVMAWHAHLQADPLPDQIEVIAASRTLLLKTATRTGLAAALTRLPHLRPAPLDTASAAQIVIDVVYDGADLAAVAAHYDVSVEALIRRHTEEEWLAAFGGFAPGFTYCQATAGHWDTPRRDSPRTRVPAGSVALAGQQSAVYPLDSPGGWQLIGRTEAALWDLEREPPNLITPGDTVRYRAVTATAPLTHASAGPPAATDTSGAASRPAARVEATGLQTLVQDRGRAGFGDVGVSTSGALDRAAARQANRILGNDAAAPVLENLLGGLRLRADIDLTLAVTGAEVPVDIDGQPAPMQQALVVPAGAELRLGTPVRGIRSYLGVRGGLAVARVMGSAASDTLSRLGPAPVRTGDRLAIPVRAPERAVGEPEPSTLPAGDLDAVTLRVVPGPRADWCAPGEVDVLCAQTWQISGDSDRVAARLQAADGARALRRAPGTGELPSEGMVSGALQIPPSGEPVLFLADHPVTGGYPVIAVVIAEDLDLAAQLGPGTRVRFACVPATEPSDPIPGDTP